jgi:periplasmic divalent cation tolerance protein
MNVSTGEASLMNHEYVIVLTTLPADADGPAFARALVEAHLAACVNLLPPMVSIYRWEGAIEQETERQVIIKTSRDRVLMLWERVRELHPYDVPEFIVLPIVDGNDAYLRWVAESTG